MAEQWREVARFLLGGDHERGGDEVGERVVDVVGGLLAFDRDYLAPYDSAIGQAMLLVIAATFAASFAAMERMGRVAVPDRFIGRRTAASVATSGEVGS